jgi:hypothetical protein
MEQRLLVVGEQIGNAAVELFKPRAQKILLREPAGKNSNRPDSCFACGFRIERRIAHDDTFFRGYLAQAFHRGLKNVGMRF